MLIKCEEPAGVVRHEGIQRLGPTTLTFIFLQAGPHAQLGTQDVPRKSAMAGSLHPKRATEGRGLLEAYAGSATSRTHAAQTETLTSFQVIQRPRDVGVPEITLP